MQELLRICTGRQVETIALIRQLVELESPSGDKAAADICGEFIARELTRRGANVTLHPQSACGNHIEARFTGSRPGRPLMILGHYDTVFPNGTLARRPWREADGKLYGPGVFDMKSGIALALCAVTAVVESRGELPRPVIISLNADEENGSEASRNRTEALASECDAVLVAEPAQGTAVKTARKGVGDFTLRVAGVAAHAGLDFSKGHNAVLELARQIERVAEFTNLERGLTVNVGFVQGGSRAVNVVPAEATAIFDVRIPCLQDGPDIAARFASLRPFDPHCRLEVSGGINRPPLERTAGVVSLYERARAIAREIGFDLAEAAVGGGSDGNFTGALGIPTLDGLGAVGEGAHAETESVLVEWLPRRAALLAGLIATI
jgi:glutamate carboxypeptidase